MTRFTLTDVRVFTGAELSGPQDVAVHGSTIVDVSPCDGASGTDGDGEVVDGRGQALLPGLIDAHVHLHSQADLTAAVRAGVTTMIDLGTHPMSLVDSLRGLAGLTDIRSAGSAASAPGSPQSTLMGFPAESVVTGAEDAARYLDWRVAEGSDLIKIIIEDPRVPDAKALAPETIAALVTGARTRGLQTVAHVATSFTYRMGADAGVDVLTHAPLDQPADDSLIAQLLEQGTVVSPTLVMMKGVADIRAHAPGPKLDVAHSLETVRRLHTAGVPIIAGTDAHSVNPPGFPEVPHGASLHEELALLVQSGLTPAEALQAATGAAARYHRLPDRGTIETGQRADLVLVDGDPTVDIAASTAITGVWVAGGRVR